MEYARPDALVSTDWLAARLDAPDVRVVDGSFYLPAMKRDAAAEFLAGHIPGAVRFDVDDIADKSSPLPHMLPSTVKFASRMKKMGIGDGMRIVVYDTVGLFSAARVWWTFRVMGHQDVAVLDGGLKKWKAEGRPLTSEPPPPRTSRHFTPRFDAGLVRDLSEVRALAESGNGQIADARGPGRFAGTEPEPRPGLRGGHIPGARNVPYSSLLNGNGTLKSAAELRRTFDAAGIDVRRPVVTSCGSGITAAIVALALAEIGRPDAAVYDGSWSEWGQDSIGTPVETGPAR